MLLFEPITNQYDNSPESGGKGTFYFNATITKMWIVYLFYTRLMNKCQLQFMFIGLKFHII